MTVTELRADVRRTSSRNYNSVAVNAGASVSLRDGEDAAGAMANLIAWLNTQLDLLEHDQENEVPVIPNGQDRKPMSAGQHVLTLMPVTAKRIKPNMGEPDGPDGLVGVLQFKFTSDHIDPHTGQHEELDMLTPMAVTQRNKLGRLATQLAGPGAGFVAGVHEFNTDWYTYSKYHAYVINKPAKSDPSKVVAELVDLVLAVPAQQLPVYPAPPPGSPPPVNVGGAQAPAPATAPIAPAVPGFAPTGHPGVTLGMPQAPAYVPPAQHAAAAAQAANALPQVAPTPVPQYVAPTPNLAPPGVPLTPGAATAAAVAAMGDPFGDE